MLTTGRTDRRRRGYVTAFVALSLTTLMAFVALSIDGGLMLDQRRRQQAAADSAAIAAAGVLYYNFPYNKGADSDGKANAAAVAEATANGFTDGTNGAKVEVFIPPQTGPFTGILGHTEVVITYDQPQYFSRLFGSVTYKVKARAVSRGKTEAVGNAILTLAASGKGTLTSGGNGLISVTGSPIQVNSNDVAAAYSNGGGTMAAPEFDITGVPGYYTAGGGSFSGTIVPNSPPIPDPLAYLPPPDPNTLTLQSKNKTQISGQQVVTLNPGVYVGGITVTAGASVTMNPGIYYMAGGGFTYNGSGPLSGSGIMIYNAATSTSDTVSLSGQGVVNLSPMTTGPYKGILIFQDRTSTAPVSVVGNGSMTISGTFYAANAQLAVSGNGAQDTIGSQYISSTLKLGGNGNFAVSWSPELAPATRKILLVE